MYEDLIKELRYLEKVYRICGNTSTKEYKLATDAADAIEELQSLLYLMKSNADWLSEKIPKWIPATERLPELHEEVLVCTEDYGETELGFATVAVYDGSGWLECWERKQYLNYVTHWMPLPEPPKEE